MDTRTEILRQVAYHEREAERHLARAADEDRRAQIHRVVMKELRQLLADDGFASPSTSLVESTGDSQATERSTSRGLPAVLDVLQRTSDWLTVTDVRDALVDQGWAATKDSEAAVRAALNRGIHQGRITKRNRDGRTKEYQLAQTPEGPAVAGPSGGFDISSPKGGDDGETSSHPDPGRSLDD
jgi:hypothetical protein